jgi:hypothetical protein
VRRWKEEAPASVEAKRSSSTRAVTGLFWSAQTATETGRKDKNEPLALARRNVKDEKQNSRDEEQSREGEECAARGKEVAFVTCDVVGRGQNPHPETHRDAAPNHCTPLGHPPGFVACFAPQEIQTHRQEFAELGKHFVLEFENSSIKFPQKNLRRIRGFKSV